MIQNTAKYKEDFMKTLYKKSLNSKTISDKIKMCLENNIKKKRKYEQDNEQKKNKNILQTFDLICSHIFILAEIYF